MVGSASNRNTSPPPFVVSQRFFASLIGVIAIGLPTLLLVVSWLRGCFYDSISHHYYAPILGDLFVVALATIGIFLFAYRGRSRREDVVSQLAGMAALGVALLPTTGAGISGTTSCSGRAFFGGGSFEPLYSLFPGAEILHFCSAAFLLGFLAYYALFNFTQTHSPDSIDDQGGLTPAKRKRNRLYRASGITIIVCLVLLGLYAFNHGDWSFWNELNLTFWLESVALIAFGISWIVRGRVFDTMLRDEDDM